jgi:alpha-L-rhamnosidase
MRSDVGRVANFTSSDTFLSELRAMNRNTFDSNMMSVQSDCPHRERFGYGGDPLGCGEAGLSMYDFSSFYRKRVLDFNDASRGSITNSTSFAGFTETSPFVNIADAGVQPGSMDGPIGWEAFAPVAQLWLYKYYGDTITLRESYPFTKAYVEFLEKSDVARIEGGLGDWMPAQQTSKKYTGLGFQRMSYRAFANISAILNESSSVAAEWNAKADEIDAAINKEFF